MSRWRIRAANSADEQALAIIEVATFDGGAWSPAAIRASLADPTTSILLATEGDSGAPIGFLIWRATGGDAEILRLAVALQHRRCGLGSTMLEMACKAARARRLVFAFLEVGAGNDPARAFYARAGFEEISRRKGYYSEGEDACVLRRAL